MRLPSGLPVALAGAALTWTGCATPHDAELVERRSQYLYGSDTTSGADPASLAQRAEDPRLLESADLERYVAYGLAHSATLRAEFERWRAATERPEQVSTLPDPRLSYTEFLEEVQTRTGPQQRRFGIAQAFPWPGQLAAQARVEEFRAEAGWQRVEGERLRVQSSIEVAFHEYAFLGRELEITEELRDLLHGLEPIVQGRVRAGASQADLLRLQVEIGRLEDGLASLERRRPAVSARLAAALNLDLEAAALLPVPPLTAPVTVRVDVEHLQRLARERSPRLLERLEAVRVGEAAEALSAFRRKPNFSVGLDTIVTGGALNQATQGSGDDPLLVSVSMSLPVWGSAYAAAEREARHLARAAREQFVAAERDLRAEIEEHAFVVDDAARRISLYRESLLPRAREALTLTLATYRAGEASVLDLIDSERAQLEFELSLWRACREYLQGDARLRALTGGDRR